jgi:hypothetical protein
LRAVEQDSQAWHSLDSAEVVNLLASVGTIRYVSANTHKTSLAWSSISRPVHELHAQPAVDIFLICPDPLIFALSCGLPRSRTLDKQIDGGSEWEQFHDIPGTPLTAISRIASIQERRTSDMRRMIRSIYEIEFRNLEGKLIGVARGTSLDFEVASGVKQ